MIQITDEAVASPYPSTINVTGFTGEVSRVTLTLHGFSHTYPDDVDILLVGPTGVKAFVMSDAGGSFETDEITITLDDAAIRTLPNSSQLTAGSYTPANWGSSAGDNFPAPAPAPPYVVPLASFNGTGPNGAWSLFIRDDILDNSGSLNGWSLTIQTAPPLIPSLAITLTNALATVAWPTNALGFTLETRTSLDSDVPWLAITNPVVLTNGQFSVVLPLDSTARFFRLRK